MRLIASLFAVAAMLVLTTGCTERNNTNTVPAKGADPAAVEKPNDSSAVETAEVSAGRQVYDAQKCARCHRIDTAGGPPAKGKAPNLTKVGAKRSADWIAAHVRDPKTHGGKMPAYPESKINDTDLKALADYLASLK